ncbi:MAG: mandelate racemase/muconate lactonizing enzyme family protein [Chloroflexi bacterium]|nr:mandelate racemase/muconate lactonizing enzyme family protein [Chloroflexota bacterium]
MRITDVRVVNLIYSYGARGFQYAGGVATGRLTSLVRVSTDAGIEGVGSVYSHPDMVRAVVEGNLRDLLLGEDPVEVERLWTRMYQVTRWYGRKGAAMSALGGVDVALWDIRGKALGKPVYELLGARRQRVPAYASALLWKDDISALAEEARGYVTAGYAGVKMRLGRTWQYDIAAVRAVREAIGPGRRLMVDGSMRYTLTSALRLARELEAVDAFWFEEPFPPEELAAYAALRSKARVPLAAGENEFGVQGFQELIRAHAVDIAQPDCSRSGGLTECHRIGVLAGQAGLDVATHTWSDAVALVANMHLIASLPNGLTVEVDRTGNPFIDDLLSEPLRLVDGELAMPTGPGLGITLNEDLVAAHTLPPGEPIPHGSYSDMVFGHEYLVQRAPYTCP